MNKKNALVSIVLIALMSLSLIPIAAFGFHTPSSTDDSLSETFGPRPSQLLIKIYTDYTAEIAGLKSKEFDIMDWGLDPIDFQFFESTDPTHAQFSTAFYAEFGLFEYDLNNGAMPMSIIAFRQGISHLIDKDYFINTYLAGSAARADSPIASLPGWFDPALNEIYNAQPRTSIVGNIADDPQDWIDAYNLFTTALGPAVPDPEDPTYFTWTWTTPPPLNIANGTFPAVANNHLLVFARSDSSPARLQQGQELKTYLEDVLPATLVANGFPRARVHVDLYNVPRSVTSNQVMRYFRYHVYTGGWSMGRDPDFLTAYTAAQIFPSGQNYEQYFNPAFETAVNDMLTQPTPATSKPFADLAQDILMGDAGTLPVWTFAGYKAYLANWRGVVNQAGFGTNSWWTFLNAHLSTTKGGDVIRYGWQGDVISLNVISAQWLWDWEVLGKVYDSLIAVNPYNVAQDLPYIAQDWTIGSYGTGNTKITFSLREDVFWQDVPFKDRSAITYDGASINGPFQGVPFTPIDVAFSLMYIRDNPDSWNGYLAGPVDHVAVNMAFWGSMWSSAKPGWYTGDTLPTPIPWQSNYVQNDPTLAADEITVFLNQPMGWIGLHWIGGIPLIPYHIWRHITQSVSTGVDTIGNDIIYGTGDYIYLTRTAGVSLTMIPYTSGQSYRGITLGQSYFYQPVRPPEEPVTGAVQNGPERSEFNYATGVLTLSDELKNYISTDDLTVSVTQSWEVKTYNTRNQLLFSASGVTAAQVVVIPNGVTVTVTSVVNVPGWVAPGVTTNKIVYSEDLSWTITADTNGPVPWVGRVMKGGDFFPTGGYYVSDQYIWWTPADVNHDGIVNIQDAAQIGLNWQKTVPPAPVNVDINGDGIINIQDAAQIGLNWQKSAAVNAPGGFVWQFTSW